MGDKTGIAWCNRTFNPWIGCTKESEGCENCYAERENELRCFVSGWGKGIPRRRTSTSYWNKPYLWAKDAAKRNTFDRVFCASLADVFDSEVNHSWRTDLFDMIENVNSLYPDRLEWLFLTKREYNINGMLPQKWIDNPPKFLRIGVTAENDRIARKRIPVLLESWKGKNFISIEPMISSFSIKKYAFSCPECGQLPRLTMLTEEWRFNGNRWEHYHGYPAGHIETVPNHKIDWVIVGTESVKPGKEPRICYPDWIRTIRDDCIDGKVKFFLKQFRFNEKLVKNPEFDGIVWNEFPEY